MNKAKAQQHHTAMLHHLGDAIQEAIELLKAVDEDPTAVKLLGTICTETNSILEAVLKDE